METSELIAELALGEDTTRQWKADVNNADQLAAELVAFCNTIGGKLFIGVDDKTGEAVGLSQQEIGRINQLISNTASQNVRPAINPITENVLHVSGHVVMVVTVPEGIAKPYMDQRGFIWVKSGSDKRRVTAREELQRMFQSAGLIHGDEVPANGLSISDVDLDYFRRFYESWTGESLDDQPDPLPKVLENMNLAKDSMLNVAGALLFAKQPGFRLPVFMVKAIHYPGAEVSQDNYLSSEDIRGKLVDILQRTMSFILGGLSRVQGNQGINSQGQPEIPRDALEELIVNALVHRDYFVSAPVRVFIYSDRVEIISPGHLPNNLTIANVLSGNSNIRNPILASFATKALPYRGMGTGVRRAVRSYPHIELEDDREGNTFRVILHRNPPTSLTAQISVHQLATSAM